MTKLKKFSLSCMLSISIIFQLKLNEYSSFKFTTYKIFLIVEILGSVKEQRCWITHTLKVEKKKKVVVFQLWRYRKWFLIKGLNSVGLISDSNKECDCEGNLSLVDGECQEIECANRK